MEDTVDTSTKQPTVVLKLSEHLSSEAVAWLVNKISADKSENGCQLNVSQEADLLFITASFLRFLLGAEVIGLKKEYKDGTIREFSFDDSHNFKFYNDDDFLMESECHEIIKYELYELRSLHEKCVPGHPFIVLHPGQSILNKLMTKNLITDCFPLHNRPALAYLKKIWFKKEKLTFVQPINSIQEYYGHTLAIYFAFVNYYTNSLIPLIFAVILNEAFVLVDGIKSSICMVILITCWSTALLITWKRKSKEYFYKWGNLDVKVI